MSNTALLAQPRRRKSSSAFEIDDEDRQHYYKQHGRSPSATRIRPSRVLPWVLIGIATFLVLLLFTGRREKSIDWSQYGYSLYATDVQSLCNAFMVFETLKRLGSKADRVLIYPNQWDLEVHSETDRSSYLLKEMEKKYKVKLLPVDLIGTWGPAWPGTLNKEATWDTSMTKLIAFSLTSYKRLIHLDSDITLLQHMDDLFFLPDVPVAMPRAYWADVPPATPEGGVAWPLTSLLILLKPNQKDFKYMMETLQSWRQSPEFASNKRYDMELLNHRFGSSAMVLPQRPYALLTSEFRNEEHSRYLGEPRLSAHWDPDAVMKEAKLIHFSDWPVPKPWIMWSLDAVAEMQPQCGGLAECRERKIWKDLYDDFRHRRRDLCKILSVPATDWTQWKAMHGIGNSSELASAAESSEAASDIQTV